MFWPRSTGFRREASNVSAVLGVPTDDREQLWEGRAGPGQCYLRISIKPLNSRGMLLAHVDLGAGLWTTSDSEPQNSATIRFLTEYAAVDRFAAELEQVLDSKRELAVLTGFTN